MQRVTVTERENNSDLRLQVGDELIVRLEANPGSGYSWSVVGEEGGVLNLAGEPTFEKSGERRLGGVEQQVFTFRAQSAGMRMLRLEYRRPWEKQAPAAKTFSIHVIAGD
jgi:inhibitor of cysteine peptidase